MEKSKVIARERNKTITESPGKKHSLAILRQFFKSLPHTSSPIDLLITSLKWFILNSLNLFGPDFYAVYASHTHTGERYSIYLLRSVHNTCILKETYKIFWISEDCKYQRFIQVFR